MRKTICSSLSSVAHRFLKIRRTPIKSPLFSYPCILLVAILALHCSGTWAQTCSPSLDFGNLPSAGAVNGSPQFSLTPGYYPSAQTLTITEQTPNTTVYFTTDGSYPQPYVEGGPGPNTRVYSGPITLSTSVVVVAEAGQTGPYTCASYFIGTSPNRFIYTFAGANTWGYAGDGGPATLALFNSPKGTALDSVGNLYIADEGNGVIRKVTAATGIITTVATGFSSPNWIAIDAANNIYVGDSTDNAVKEVDASTGAISTIASGLGVLNDVTSDAAGNVYISAQAVVYKVAAGTGTVATIAGTTPGYSGDGGPATSAQIQTAYGLAFDSYGNLYISDTGNSVIRKVDAATGIITTFSQQAGTLIAFDAQNNLYIASLGNTILEVNAQTGNTTTIGGIWSTRISAGGSGDLANNVAIYPDPYLEPQPEYISVDAAGNVYVSDDGKNGVWELTVTSPTPTMTTPAPVLSPPPGTYDAPQIVTISDTTPGAAYTVNFFDGSGGSNFYGSLDVTGSVKMTLSATAPGYLPSPPVTVSYTITSPPPTVISTVAGGGTTTLSGGPATSIELADPEGLAIDKGGNLYIADNFYEEVFRVDTSGNLTSITNPGFLSSGTWVPAVGVATDPSGNVYFTDYFVTEGFCCGGQVYMVSAQTGAITTVAGGGSTLGDGGPALQAQFGAAGLTFDSAGNLYIADEADNRIRRIDAKTNIITTVAGGGTSGLGDGGPATQAQLSGPQGLAFDASGNMYITDVNNGRIRMVDAETGIITTIAGNGIVGSSGNGGPALDAEVTPGLGIAVDAQGNVYFGDVSTVRRINKADGTIVNYAGNGYASFGGDGGSATIAGLCGVQGLAFDSAGSLYIADTCNSDVRKVTVAKPTYAISATPVTIARGASGTSTVTISSQNGYAGIVSLSCAVTSSPSGATDAPTCSASQTVTLSASATSGTATVTVNTTTPSASMLQPVLRNQKRWTAAGGGAALALLLFFIPRRRRFSKTLFGVAMIAALAGGLVACGGGSGTKTITTGPANPGTTAGSYTITVTGTGNDSAATTETVTFTLTVN